MGNHPDTKKVMIAMSFTNNLLDNTGSLENDVHHFTFLVTFQYSTINDNTRRTMYEKIYFQQDKSNKILSLQSKTHKTNKYIQTM